MRSIKLYNPVTAKTLTFGTSRPFLLEKLDGVSIDAALTAEAPIGRDGQVTTLSRLPGRSIVAQVAVYLPDRRDRKHYFDDVFLPALLPPPAGTYCTLTIDDGLDTYSIDCRPSSVPMPTRQDSPAVYRAEISLTADSAFFRKNSTITATFTPDITQNHTLWVPTHGPSYPVITLRQGYNREFMLNSKSLWISETLPEDIIINTQTFNITTASGDNATEYVDPGRDIDAMFLTYGNNAVHLSGVGDVQVAYDILSLGVVE
jgi:hypothetical protein